MHVIAFLASFINFCLLLSTQALHSRESSSVGSQITLLLEVPWKWYATARYSVSHDQIWLGNKMSKSLPQENVNLTTKIINHFDSGSLSFRGNKKLCEEETSEPQNASLTFHNEKFRFPFKNYFTLYHRQKPIHELKENKRSQMQKSILTCFRKKYSKLCLFNLN